MAYTGTSIVDYLSSVGQASDYTSRAKLAQQYGITNYTGTSGQNTQLLNLLRGQTTTPTPLAQSTQPSLVTAKSPTTTTTPASLPVLNPQSPLAGAQSKWQGIQLGGISNEGLISGIQTTIPGAGITAPGVPGGMIPTAQTQSQQTTQPTTTQATTGTQTGTQNITQEEQIKQQIATVQAQIKELENQKKAVDEKEKIRQQAETLQKQISDLQGQVTQAQQAGYKPTEEIKYDQNGQIIVPNKPDPTANNYNDLLADYNQKIQDALLTLQKQTQQGMDTMQQQIDLVTKAYTDAATALANQPSFLDQYNKLMAESGVPEAQTELARLTNRANVLEEQLETLPADVRKRVQNFLVSQSEYERITNAESEPLTQLYNAVARAAGATADEIAQRKETVMAAMTMMEKDQLREQAAIEWGLEGAVNIASLQTKMAEYGIEMAKIPFDMATQSAGMALEMGAKELEYQRATPEREADLAYKQAMTQATGAANVFGGADVGYWALSADGALTQLVPPASGTGGGGIDLSSLTSTAKDFLWAGGNLNNPEEYADFLATKKWTTLAITGEDRREAQNKLTEIDTAIAWLEQGLVDSGPVRALAATTRGYVGGTASEQQRAFDALIGKIRAGKMFEIGGKVLPSDEKALLDPFIPKLSLQQKENLTRLKGLRTELENIYLGGASNNDPIGLGL